MTHLQVGAPLPGELKTYYDRYLAPVPDTSILCSISGRELTLLTKLTNATQSEIEQLSGEIYVTLFVHEYVPFLLFTYKTFYFDVAVTDPDIISGDNTLFIYAVEGSNDKILSLSSVGLPMAFIEKIQNILANNPHKDAFARNDVANKTFNLINRADMVKLGKSVLIRAI